MIHMVTLPALDTVTLAEPLAAFTAAGQGVGWAAEPLAAAVSLGTGVALALQGGVFTIYHPDKLEAAGPPAALTAAGQGVGWAAEPPFAAVSSGTGVAFALQGGVFTIYHPEELNCEVGPLAARAEPTVVIANIKHNTAARYLRVIRHLLNITTLCRLVNNSVIQFTIMFNKTGNQLARK
jgi:hypothetical protein